VKLSSGHEHDFFTKVRQISHLILTPNATGYRLTLELHQGGHGKIGAKMMEGSFEAENALHEFIPEHVPRPIAWGTYSSDPDTHFYNMRLH
jgi:hypothetical protein